MFVPFRLPPAQHVPNRGDRRDRAGKGHQRLGRRENADGVDLGRVDVTSLLFLTSGGSTGGIPLSSGLSAIRCLLFGLV